MKVVIGLLIGFVAVTLARSQRVYLQTPWINESDYLRDQYNKRQHRLQRA